MQPTSRFALEALCAAHGDALLLHFGAEAEPRLVIVDGGPKGVYDSVLRPRLLALREAHRERSGDWEAPLPIRLLMVSHIDEDHIHGVLQLTGELADSTRRRQPLPFEVVELWHNSFDDLMGQGQVQALAQAMDLGASFAAGTESASLPQALAIDRDSRAVVASVKQGRQVRLDAEAVGIPYNLAFEDGLITPQTTVAATALSAGDEALKLTVIGPSKDRLERLRRAWIKFVTKLAQARDTAQQQAIAAAYSDRSVANLSSLVVLVEHGGRRMLLTGDARGDHILEGLDAAGLLTDGCLHVDLLKVQHHGSERGVTLEFFQRLTADHYVLSADGRDGNPDLPMLKWLSQARGNDEYVIHMPHAVPHADAFWAADQAGGKRYSVRHAADDRPDMSVTVEL